MDREPICPVCNGLTSIIKQCGHCGSSMVDGGMVSDYLDNYSPYLPIEYTARIDGEKEEGCIHLLYCKKCGNDQRIKIEKMRI